MKRLPVLVIWLVVVAAAVGFAQSTNSKLSGTVLDPTGAVVPNVPMNLENVRTGIALTTTSNADGIYIFASVQPGQYRLTADLPGFKKFVMSDITVDVGSQLSINVPLELSATAETVEVKATPESPLILSGASVGGVVSGQKLLELPIPGRDALDVVLTQPGVVGSNFGGTRISALNVTRDGINIMDQRINSGVNSVIFSSVDVIDEVKVVTSPVDAEFGRGSGQVQLSTRSGGNVFHGSVYNFHQNTVLNANNWFNNLNGFPRDSIVHNQFGGRIGGPILKENTFFHFTYEGQRLRATDNAASIVYTRSARDGKFRFYPGVQNANANSTFPIVDLLGNPIAPTPTAQLQSIDVFGRDPFRLRPDPTGTVQKLLAAMPPPNDFRFGDGLNTAGFTWRRKATSDYDQFNFKIDHLFNDRHRAAFTYTRDDFEGLNTFMPQPFPTAPGGSVTVPSSFYSVVLNSTFSPRMVNEFHAGTQRGRVRFYAPWELPGGRELMPTINGVGYLPVFALVTDPLPSGDDPQGRISPLYAYGDKMEIYHGKHGLKFGGEVRFVSTNGFNSFNVVPRAFFGLGFGPDVTGLDSFTIAGLGTNEGTAQGLLIDLTGTVDTVVQAFNASGGKNPTFLSGEGKQRTWRKREFSMFFQDDFKVSPSVTLNLGVRYEFYGVPWDANGRTAGLVGGSTGLFGISGNSWSDLYQPGRAEGSLTQVQLIGKGSLNPNTLLYNNDWNNFAPVVGLSWSVPYFGKDKTVLRAGYSVAFETTGLRLIDIVSGDQPGLTTTTSLTSGAFLDLSQIRLPLQPVGDPLSVVPIDDRSQVVRAFDNNLRTPYTQNWNLTIQRELPSQVTLDIRYVGSKGTKQLRAVNINEVNIIENGLLDAFVTTQQGGNSALLDRLFLGFNLGTGTINGTTVRASSALRQFATTRAYLANNNLGDFALFLNTASVSGRRGGVPRTAGFPENWIVANPQFGAANYVGNFANSSYHSLQLNANKRFASGWTLQSNYTWSRALGEEEGDSQDLQNSYRNGRNRRIDKRLLAFHRTHVVRNSGLWDLPFGPGQRFLSGTHGILGHVVRGWQIGGIFNLFSGTPIGLYALTSSLNQFADNTPTLVGSLPKDTGEVKRIENGVVYFDALKQIADPTINNLTALQLLNQRSTMKAITDASGQLILVNPTPGTLGSLSQTSLEGPGAFRLDVNLIKKIQMREGRELQVRGDALNLLNSPIFGNPVNEINSTVFGRIIDSGGERSIRLSLRFSF